MSVCFVALCPLFTGVSSRASAATASELSTTTKSTRPRDTAFPLPPVSAGGAELCPTEGHTLSDDGSGDDEDRDEDARSSSHGSSLSASSAADSAADHGDDDADSWEQPGDRADPATDARAYTLVERVAVQLRMLRTWLEVAAPWLGEALRALNADGDGGAQRGDECQGLLPGLRNMQECLSCKGDKSLRCRASCVIPFAQVRRMS